MSFQVYVNNIAINDEPMGLTDATVKIMRDEQFSGIVSNIVSDLSFWGDGYDIIYGLFQGTTGCLDIPIRIEQTDCLGFIFEGIIFLADIELDISRCIAKCTLSDNSLSSLIGRNYDVKVPIDSGVSLDGTSLTQIGEYLYNPFYTGVDVPNENPLNPEAVDGPFKWFNILDLYSYIPKYFLNDNTFSASTINGYLTDPTKYFEVNHWRVVSDAYTNPFGGPPFSCDVEFYDAFGVLQTIPIDFGECEDPTGPPPLRPWSFLTLNAIASRINEHFDITSYNPYDGEWRDNYCDLAMMTTHPELYPPGSTPGPPREREYYIDIYFPWDAIDFRIVNIQGFAPVNPFTITEENEYNYGPYAARMTSGKILKNFYNPAIPNDNIARGGMINVSFSDLMSGFGKVFNLGIKFGIAGTGQYTMEVGKESDLYETTEAFAIEPPYEVKLAKDNKFGLSSLKIGQSNQNPSFKAGIQEEVSYVSNVCSEADFDATTSFVIPLPQGLGYLDGIIGLDDNTLYVAEKDPNQYTATFPGGGNYYKIQSHGVSYRRYTYDPLYDCVVRFQDDMLAGFVNHPEIARAYVHRAGDGFSWNGNFIPNNSGPKIRNRVTFEAPITVEQFNLIQANPYQKIRFGTGLYETGWVMSLEYNITSGMTKFELLTE